ncbi:MAG: ATP-binding protein [Myxococcota bacterium]
MSEGSSGGRAWYQQVFDATSNAVLVYSTTGTLVDVNPAACAMLQRTRDELMTMSPRSFIHSDSHHVFREFVEAVAAGREFRGAGQGVAADGSVFDVEAHGLPIDVEGERFAFATLVDVSERNRLQAELSQRSRLEALGTLAGGVAHDFNNLLTVMQGLTSFARKERDAVRLRQYLDELADASERAAQLTSQLVAFSRKQRMVKRRIGLNDVVERLRPMLQRILPDDIVLSMDLSPGMPKLTADIVKLEQVMLNLCINARDAMPEGGELHVATSTRRAGLRYVELEVSDTGEGIDETTRDRIFEPFFTTKERGSGTGLGLATAYGIVQQHGGNIEVDSRRGRGTTFRVLLPIDAVAIEAAEPQRPPKRPMLAGIKVVVVDDDPAIRRVVARILATAGAEVDQAGPETAVDVVRRFEPDLLVTDVVMPQINGVQLCARVREFDPELRVLFMSGYTADVISQRGGAAPGIRLLPKPFTVDEFLVAARNALEETAAPPS